MRISSAILVAVLLMPHLVWTAPSLALQNPIAQGSLRGIITDPSGARIPGATVELRHTDTQQTLTSDASGQYSITGVTPGAYDIRIAAPGFQPLLKQAFQIAGATTLNVQLTLEVQTQRVDVQEATTATTDPDSNGSATVLSRDELAALSDDPDELSRQLQALAGPGVGLQSSSQISTDGFNGGVPPKAAIREIRINSNPFSAEYDQPGSARVEILTKPGGDIFHGQFSVQYNNQHFNSRSPLFVQSSSLPPYRNLLWNGNITGPLKKNRATFTFDFNHRNITENAFILATNLDSALARHSVNEALLTPQHFTSVVPRVDLALNDNHALIVRYENTRQESDNIGAGGFRLAEAAFDQRTRGHTLQITETGLLSPMLVNEARFQFARSTRVNLGQGSLPSIFVQDAFTGGSATNGNSSNRTTRWELSNNTILSYGPHTLKWGARVRHSNNEDTSANNFNGTFTFFGGSGPVLDADSRPVPGTSVQLTALDVYQRTLMMQQRGLSASEIRAAGGGASLFSLNAGSPLTRVTQTDLGAFFNDDWKLSPNVTFSYGLRYETQTNVRKAGDWAPRLGIAWGLDGKGTAPAKTVLRVGAGSFYQRVADFTTLNAARYNGVAQQSYLLTNPDFFPSIPPPASLAGSAQPQTLQLISDKLQSPLLIFGNVGIDRQFSPRLRLSMTYFKLRAVHFLRSRDINARLPVTNEFPFGDSTVRMLTESSALASQQQFVINPTFTYKKLSIFGSYVITSTWADFEGLPADHYNLHDEWAPAFGDIRHRLNVGPTFPLPLKMMVNALFVYNSAATYNITTGLPNPSGDGGAVQRPAVTNLAPAACVGAALRYVAEFGCLDLLPAPGTARIPKNFGRGPSASNMTLRLSRTWDFGTGESAAAPAGPPAAVGGTTAGAPPALPSKYHLTFSLYAINPLNHPSFGAPNGNLTSPFFGKSLNLQGFFLPGNATYNRKVTVQLQLAF